MHKHHNPEPRLTNDAKKSGSTHALIRNGIFFVLFAIFLLDQPLLADGGTLSLNTRWWTVRGISQPAPKDATGVNVRYRLNGKEKEVLLVFKKDTFLWKGSDYGKSADAILHIRDGRFAQALAQLDLSNLPKDAEILSASLDFRVVYIEHKGQPGEISCSRILTPWTEDATWLKPDHTKSSIWNGMAVGHDYADPPFASLKVESFETGKDAQPISIPGFEDAVKAWRDGTWENDGFVISLSGPALQVGIPSSKDHPAQNIALGGETAGSLLLVPNLPLLSRVAPKPSDILEAHPVITIHQNKSAPASPTQLSMYEVSLTEDGKDIDPQSPRKLIATVPLAAVSPEGVLTLPDISKILQGWQASPDLRHALAITVDGSGKPGDSPLLVSSENGHATALQLELPSYQPAQLFQPPISPKPGIYTQVQDGHLSYGGQRLRLWGVVGAPDVTRIADMGFNAERIWNPSSNVTYTPASVKQGDFAPYTKGDGSKFDVADKHFADLKSHGLFVMFAALNDSINPALLLDDDSFVTKGDDWNDWKTAIKAGGDFNNYLYVDKRLQEIKKRHARNLLTHINPYTGKAYGEDEAIAVYEVFNENGFLYKGLSGGLSKWNPYFLKELQNQWNDWLRKKYGTDAELTQSWGSVKPGESLENSSVAPAPGIEKKNDYPEKRADDFTQFLAELENNFHQDFRSYCRSLFPTGVGINVAPFSFDTLFRPNLTWSYYQSLGDVNSFGMYFWNLRSSLDKPPAAFVIDSFTVENKPSILYETNVSRPNPYRAEYPLKLAALASYQDWDGIFWHYWGPSGKDEAANLGYLTATMGPPYPNDIWEAVHHEVDPVMGSAMTMAGQIFLHSLIPPASKPDIIEVGGSDIFSYAHFSGMDLAQLTFKDGSALKFSPEAKSGVTLNGAPLPPPARIDHAIASGEYVKWDWPNGRMIIDSPSVKAYVGKISGPFRFSDGITLSDVSTPWICFAMVSDDGSPLAGQQSVKRILMSGVYDAENTGFQFNYDVQGGPVEQAHAVVNVGREPVVVTPVDYKVSFPTQIEGTLTSYDFALRKEQETTITGTNVIAQAGATPYLDILSIEKRGAQASLPLAQATSIPLQDEPGTTGTSEGSVTESPISSALLLPELPWDLNPTETLQKLRGSKYTFTNLSEVEIGQSGNKEIDMTGTSLPSLWNNQADISLHFTQDKLSNIEVTFTQPPALPVILDSFTKRLGAPVEKKVEAQYGDTRLHWLRNDQPHDVLVTESQGTMKILISP